MKKLILSLFAVGLFIFTSCDEDDNMDTTANLALNISGLEDLGPNFAYEGWIITNDASPISTGTFTVDGNGNLSKTSFDVKASDLEKATTFVLSIEPVPDTDPTPAATKILAGQFSGKTASLGTSTVGGDFQNIEGKYIIATPTGTGKESEKYSGIWFLDNSQGNGPGAGLKLPKLSTGWKYEGWVVINGQPVSTGTFLAFDEEDEAAPYSGTNPGPPFPGEDFLNNAPAGLTFPTDIRGGMTVISIEPYPDNSPAPFLLKPLAKMISKDLAPGIVASMESNVAASFPKGTVTR